MNVFAIVKILLLARRYYTVIRRKNACAETNSWGDSHTNTRQFLSKPVEQCIACHLVMKRMLPLWCTERANYGNLSVNSAKDYQELGIRANFLKGRKAHFYESMVCFQHCLLPSPLLFWPLFQTFSHERKLYSLTNSSI